MEIMSKTKQKKSKGTSRLPPTGIGLVTFLDEDIEGPKITPLVVLGLSIVFIALSLLALIIFPIK